MPDFVLDADPLIPTGVPATPVEVAVMVVDPDNPLTVAEVPLLVESQQPTPEVWREAAEASPLATADVVAELLAAGIEVASPAEEV